MNITDLLTRLTPEIRTSILHSCESFCPDLNFMEWGGMVIYHIHRSGTYRLPLPEHSATSVMTIIPYNSAARYVFDLKEFLGTELRIGIYRNVRVIPPIAHLRTLVCVIGDIPESVGVFRISADRIITLSNNPLAHRYYNVRPTSMIPVLLHSNPRLNSGTFMYVDGAHITKITNGVDHPVNYHSCGSECVYVKYKNGKLISFKNMELAGITTLSDRTIILNQPISCLVITADEWTEITIDVRANVDLLIIDEKADLYFNSIGGEARRISRIQSNSLAVHYRLMNDGISFGEIWSPLKKRWGSVLNVLENGSIIFPVDATTTTLMLHGSLFTDYMIALEYFWKTIGCFDEICEEFCTRKN